MLNQKIIFILFLSIIAPVAYAQTVKLTAFKQSIISGKKSTGPSASKQQYRIYISSKYPVKITGLWINSKAFNYTTNNITEKPVVLTDGLGKQVELVPPTQLLVTEITVRSDSKSVAQSLQKWKQHIQTNEVVVTYSYKGKERMLKLKAATELEPVSLY